VHFGAFTETLLPCNLTKQLEAKPTFHGVWVVTHDSVKQLSRSLEFPCISERQRFNAQVLGSVSDTRSDQALFKLIPGRAIPSRIPKPLDRLVSLIWGSSWHRS
jgi:hypothetical protein